MESSGVTQVSELGKGSGSRIQVGMVGLGTVGSGVFKVFEQHPEIFVHRIMVRDLDKPRNLTALESGMLTREVADIVNDDAIQIVVEVMGGVELAYQVVIEAMQNGKHVVTANKELIAKHGPELFELARKHQVRLMFEGAVAGGIPIIMPLKLSLAGNRIQEMAGILNGTTNYILTKMTQEGLGFDEALSQAQAMGFAEADPTNDIEGHDAAYKIAILSSIAFQKTIEAGQLHREGITRLTAQDIENARQLGYVIKLIALARATETEALDIRVHPMLVPVTHPLANVLNEYNAIWIKGDAVGDVMFYGRGAGEMPTASAVAADILAIANDLQKGNDPFPAMMIEATDPAVLSPIADTRNKYYIRLTAQDTPGVIGQLGLACGDAGVSLESVMQKGASPEGTASIVLITHDVYERQISQALQTIRNQSSAANIDCMLRVL